MVELIRPDLTELKPRITVIGVGGAGGNAVANMVEQGLEGIDFVVANTDAQALGKSPAETRIQLGLKITQGLGAGSRPEIGRAAAEETLEHLERALEGSHMVFITAGMGGGTGTGAAPVVARAAREMGMLTVGVVTKPFSFEGARRMRQAEAGIEELQKHVDTLIIIPNQNLFLIANANTTFKQAFAMADQVLHQGVRGITDLMVMPGLINLDFADVRTVMSEMGKAMMGTGEAEGDGRAIEAAQKAIANPLLDEVSMRGAKGVIVNITGGDDLKLMEVEEAAEHIRGLVDPDANIIVGSAFDESLNGRMRVSVVATGIEASQPSLALPVQPAPAPAFQAPAASLGDAAPAPFVRTPEPAGAGASGALPAVAVVAETMPAPVKDVAAESVAAVPTAPAFYTPPAAPPPLVLSADDLVEAAPAPAPVSVPVPPSNVTPLRPPAPPEPAAEPAPTRGPTLFERMMGAKSASK